MFKHKDFRFYQCLELAVYHIDLNGFFAVVTTTNGHTTQQELLGNIYDNVIA
jgi:hypothetical protein